MEIVNTNIAFRKCSFADIPLMAKTATKAYCDHYSHVWKDNTDFYVDRSFSEEAFVKDVQKMGVEYYLIYYDELPVGIIKVNLFKSPEGITDVSMLELEKMYIRKAYCGKSIGSHSLSFLKYLAKTKKIKCIWVNVMKESKATRFYHKHNFETRSYWRLKFENLKEEYRKMVQMHLYINYS